MKMLTAARLAILLSAICVFVPALSAKDLPACNARYITRHGDRVRTTTTDLSNIFNERLSAHHSHFSDLQLTPEADNNLKLSGKKDGQPISISGPLQVAGNGVLQLHADSITKNGKSVKGFMDLLGKDLADYVNPKRAPSLTVQGNDLDINVHRLLGLSSRLTGIFLKGSEIQMQFASQPCR